MSYDMGENRIVGGITEIPSEARSMIQAASRQKRPKTLAQRKAQLDAIERQFKVVYRQRRTAGKGV